MSSNFSCASSLEYTKYCHFQKAVKSWSDAFADLGKTFGGEVALDIDIEYTIIEYYFYYRDVKYFIFISDINHFFRLTLNQIPTGYIG